MLNNGDLNEVLTDLADLSLGCELNGNRVNIFCYAEDIALLTLTENALQFMFDTLAPRLENLSLKINVPTQKQEKFNWLVVTRSTLETSQ